MLNSELSAFSEEVAFLNDYRLTILKLNFPDPGDWQIASFLSEALIFRLYRAQERFIRAIFLDACVSRRSYLGSPIESKLSCADWETAEQILKSGGMSFIDWGNPRSTIQRANIVFDRGFPINDTIAPIHATLLDLQRIRNFIAHDSKEAESGFRKAVRNYVSAGAARFKDAGELLLHRKRPRDPYVITTLIQKVAALETAYKSF